MDPAEPHNFARRSHGVGVARAETDRAPQQGQHSHIKAIHVSLHLLYLNFTITNSFKHFFLRRLPPSPSGAGASAGGGASYPSPSEAASFTCSSGGSAFRTGLLSVSRLLNHFGDVGVDLRLGQAQLEEVRLPARAARGGARPVVQPFRDRLTQEPAAVAGGGAGPSPASAPCVPSTPWGVPG